ncbi:MAG: hypothetical protein M0Z61_03670 [Nitrospiraceae bacterium]|nr:hypothetical protein [Nitrospiraceae bacterium]
MYIKEVDFKYLEGLYRRLDAEEMEKFLKALLKAGSLRSGEEAISRIKVVRGDFFDTQAVGPEEMITRTMVKKAYKEAKGGLE